MSNLLRMVTLDRSNRKKDKSVSITFITETEQSTNQFMEIDQLDGSRGVLYYKSKGELTQQEVDELDNLDVELEGKSMSQRLRNVLYIKCKKLLGRNPSNEEFKSFYRKEMEIKIQREKDRL